MSSAVPMFGGFPFGGLGAFFGLLVLIGIFFLVTWLFQWLWNITMPEVFNLNQITFWQGFRLLLIAGMLFGGMGAINN